MNNQTEQPVPAAAPQQPPKRLYRPCPCGKVPEKLALEIDQNNKLGRVYGICCGEWGVEFLRGLATDPEQILDKAHAAWDAAPRTIPETSTSP